VLTDLDNTAASRELIAALQGDPGLKLRLVDPAAGEAAVRAGDARAWVSLPPGFSEQGRRAFITQQGQPLVPVLVDPSQATTLPLVRGLLAQHAVAVLGRSALPGGAAMQLPFKLQETEAAPARGAAAGYNGYAHAFAGMGVQFILLMGVDLGVVLLTMRQQGLWKRLRAAPLSRAQLLGSRLLSCALIGSGVFAIVFAVGIAVFGVRVHGSLAGGMAVIIAFSLMTGAFGLMLAAMGRTPEATRGLAILVTLLLVMLGGAWVPSFIFPPWLQTVSAFMPTYWAVQGLDAMTWRGLPFAAALPAVGALLGYALLFAAVALARFRWDE
jgi:ABC-2 type transport system permease protein